MKNRGIRFRLTLWFSLAMIAIVVVTCWITLGASRAVLRGTIRDYLISSVEENVDKIQFVSETGDRHANSYIPYERGYLQIDLDFMNVVYDVHMALYTADGSLLYGENPLSRQIGDLAFHESRTWTMDAGGVHYLLYDRKLNIDLPDGGVLWMRGIVPDTRSLLQLRAIIRLSLVLLPLLMILSVLFGWMLTDRLLSPIRKIEKTAAEITNGDDLKKRIHVGGSNDELHRLAVVFNRMLDRLEAAFDAERRFTSDASHELRTPTSVILAQSDYILEKERSPEEYEEAFLVVRKQGERMKSLISDMLDYTRMEQGAEHFAFEALDLSGLVSETAGQMAMIGRENVRLDTQIEKDLHIQGNPALLSRLLQNLISNAYRYSKDDGHILVSLTGTEENVVLSVADDGIGIEEQDLGKIFDRFYRADASRSVHGTGLGLSMVKKIADLHHAGIEVESRPGSGSTFRIIFRCGF